MAVPKRRPSKSKIRMRRSHDGVTLPTRIKCSRCGSAKELHTICEVCGYYRGKPVREIEEA
jgi:large subunit ribosomal protein L32